MNAKEQKRLSELIDRWIINNCGGPNKVDLPTMYPYMIPTRAGALLVHLSGDNLFCRFVEPKAAWNLLELKTHRLNSYSGKWNFHFADYTADEAMEQLAVEFQYVEI